MDKKPKIMMAIIVILIIIISSIFIIRYVPFGERAEFIGTWHQPDFYGRAITFNSDGSCSDIGWPGTWEIRDDKLFITTRGGNNIASWPYNFSEDGRTLTLEGRGDWIKWGD